MTNLDSILLFVRAAELGSFSRAALACNLKKSSVSRKIAALEAELGTPLFRRSPRNMVLTEAGHTFLESAMRILSELDEVQRTLSSQSSELTGLLRISAPVEFGRRHIAPCVADFLNHAPGVALEFTLSDTPAEALAPSTDVMIHIGEPPSTRLFSRKLASSRYVICASPCYLHRAGNPHHPSKLGQHTCLVPIGSAGSAEVWVFRAPASSVALSVNVGGRFRSNSVDAVLDATMRGAGLACLPMWLVGPAIEDGRLQLVLDGYEAIVSNSDIYALYPEKRQVSPKLRSFLAFLTRYLGSPPYWERHFPAPVSPESAALVPQRE